MTRANPFWNNFSESALDLLYPRRCALCGLFHPSPICDVCHGEMARRDERVGDIDTTGALDGVARLYRYVGRAEQAVKKLKFARTTPLAAPMSLDLWEFARAVDLSDADVFVPVPIHWTRRCLRGFNQVELLCHFFPVERVQARSLLRSRATRPQSGLSPEERRRNLEGAFEAQVDLAGQKVVLVDDVLTSGYTAFECAKALKESGALQVYAITFAGA